MQIIETDISHLDEVLGGGLPKGNLLIVAGTPGSGKTVLTEEIVFRQAKRGAHCVYLTILSESHDKLIRNLEGFAFFDRHLLGKQVEIVNVYQLVISEGLEKLLEQITETVRGHQAAILVTDNFRALSALVEENALKRFVSELSARLDLLGCTGILVGTYTREEVKSSWEFAITDNVFFLHDEREQLALHRYLEVVKMRGRSYLRGLHPFYISSDAVEVFPRLETTVRGDHFVQGPGRVTFGVPGLDTLMQGGPYRGSVVLVAGTPGAGKTTLGIYFVTMGARENESGLYVTFREDEGQLTAKASGLGLDLATHLRAGRVHTLWVSGVELDLDPLALEIRQAIDRTGAQRLVFDSLTSLEQAAPPGRLAQYIEAPTNDLRRRGITSILLRQIPEVVSAELVFGGPAILSIADDLVLVRHVELRGELKLVTSVVKMSYSAHDNMVHLYTIDPTGFHVGAALTNAVGLLPGSAHVTSPPEDQTFASQAGAKSP